MRAADIIGQLVTELPRYTDKFTNNFTITNIQVITGSPNATVLITTDTTPTFSIGDNVNVEGIHTPVAIEDVTDNGATLTITTSADHDLTKNPRENIDVFARITGSSIDETFTVFSVTNRRNFTVIKGTTLPVAGDDLQEQFLNVFNGLKTVTSILTNIFEYLIPESELVGLGDPNLFEGNVNAGHRISGAVDFETANNSYTVEPDEDQHWLFVVVEDTDANKDRRGTSDAASQRGQQQAQFNLIIEGFTLYVFVPNKGEIPEAVGALIARDAAIDDRAPLFNSLLAAQFSADLKSQGEGRVTYLGDGTFAYTGGYYVHRFEFQQVAAITNLDVVDENINRALRDINFDITSLGIGDSVVELSATVDLDDEPLDT